MLRRKSSQKGYSLVELVVTLVILSVLALGTIPLVQNAVRRQKEMQLRETLRDIRTAITEFHRDASGICTSNNAASQTAANDPRSRVMISDCKIFEVDNLDRFPPTLEVLVEGVTVKPRNATNKAGRGGGAFEDVNGATGNKPDGATSSGVTDEKKKVYLREMPIDPITGKNDTWKIRSTYQAKDVEEWDKINVFDVRSGAEGEAMNEEKYSDF
jgi:general secretion pathway protein G